MRIEGNKVQYDDSVTSSMFLIIPKLLSWLKERLHSNCQKQTVDLHSTY